MAKDKGKGKEIKPPSEVNDSAKAKDTAEAKDVAAKAKEAEVGFKGADLKAADAPASHPSKNEDPAPVAKA